MPPSPVRGALVALLMGAGTALPTARAVADDAERLSMARVRLTTEAAVVAGCTRLASVRDDSVKDLRKKIVRAGGDTGLVTFDLEAMFAEVFRCPPVPPRPAHVPPPPPGRPPPPPPDLSR